MATILAVDDDPTSRDLLATVLGYAGHRVRQAGDGSEALIWVQAEQPDLIIADLLMPTMDGFEFVRQLRENPAFARTPVVFYTATYLESEAWTLARECGVSHIITKPAEPEQILRVVSSALGVPRIPVTSPPGEEFRQKHLGLLLAKLTQKTETLVPRFDAMIELGLQFVSERDPERLLGDFCTAARKMIGAKFASVGLLGREDRILRYRFASGMSSEIASRIGSSQVGPGVPESALSEREPRRLGGLNGDPQAVGLPNEHPPVHCFLSAPIHSPDRNYGWLCLAEKIGATEFNEEDEGLAQVLAAQVGRIYENGTLYAEVKRYVQQLEAEAAERKRAQEEVRRLNIELEERVAIRTAELDAANKELEAFSFSVSHDLRAPLRHIDGYCRILSEELAATGSPRIESLIGYIRKSAHRMGHLIDDLLNLSRIHREELRYAPVNLSELAREILQELRRSAPQRRVECHVEESLLVHGDSNLLRIALDNLLGNAWKFTQKCDLAQIEVGALQQNGETIYFVRDNGAGFQMAQAEKLFAAFQRLHSDQEFEGTGIGLTIVQRIILRHGGRIWAEGEPGHGATFFFSLPASRDRSVGS